jgi:transposase InsO family protein
MWPLLNREGVQCGRHRVARLRREAGIVALRRQRYVRTIQARQQADASIPNRLNQQVVVSAKNRIWAADYTFVPTHTGWLYVAVILDLYSRRIVGWAMGYRLTVELAEQALTMALVNRAPTAGLLHHSDRGSQYAATSYQRLLDEYSITTSMSRKGNCWDNACVESFFGTLKRELVYHRHYATCEDATQDIFEYLEVFYNRKRQHSTLGYDSPAEYEARTAVA